MPSQSRRFLIFILLLLVSVAFGIQAAIAQAAFTAVLAPPDQSNYPNLVANLDVHDPSGAFVHGLSPQAVTIVENGVSIAVSELQEQKPGVQLVIAITPGESFTIRDGQGISRYEYLLQGLLAGSWADQASTEDDFSLITMGGPQAIHTNDLESIRALLANYKPIDAENAPTLEVLASALQVASDLPVRPGMERAILFITPPQDSEGALGLQSIITTANQQGIRIYVWLIAAEEVFLLPDTDLLRNLALQTQGTFFAFSRSEPVPDLEIILDPLRYVYRLGYDSLVTSAGTHQVIAQVMAGSEPVTSQPVSFELNLQAPAATFQALPGAITRSYSSQPTPGVGNDAADLTPIQQLVSIQVTFPDGYERQLTRTSLFVDGLLYAENTSAPFDQFVWDLRPYIETGTHVLSAEVVDLLGITGTTGETSVNITVPTRTQGVIAVFSQKRLLLAGVIALISASILMLVLILGGRIRPKAHPGQVSNLAGSTEKTRPVGYRERKRQLKDPLTQPVKIASLPAVQTKPHTKSWRERLPWRKKKEFVPLAIAYLVPLVGSEEKTLPAPLKITSDEVTLGRDPLKSSHVIEDLSLEGMHARIQHQGKQFVITDAGSVAGTWVNYNPVPPAGVQLEHADIIYLGAVGFRFNLAEPGPPRKVIITPVEPEQ